MFITVIGKDTGAPIIINTAHLVGVVDDGAGNLYVKTVGNEPAFKIVETVDDMKELLNVVNR